MNIVFQQSLRPEIPTVYGPIEYRRFREQLQEIDRILVTSNVEDSFLADTIDHDENRCNELPRLKTALRTNILRSLLNKSCRDLSCDIAGNQLYQWFICVDKLGGGITTPSKSEIDRFEKIWDDYQIESLIHLQNQTLASPEKSMKLYFSEKAFDFQTLYADTTCLKSNIHAPVDWLLLRDAARTILKSIQLIRRKGLFHRMPDPNQLMKDINKLTIEMTQASKPRDGKKKRKKVFRKLKEALKKIVKHGIRYVKLLKERWDTTILSKNEANLVIERLANIINQIDDTVQIAHSRIISEKLVHNNEKILSLYENDVHVLNRGKFGGAIEYGNNFYIAEQIDGIIVDWDFMKGNPKSDIKILKESVRITKARAGLQGVATDRGFASSGNDKVLEKEGVYNGTCPRDINVLRVKMKDKTFREMQTRRAQTEARIGVYKGKFIGAKILRKGSENREKKVLWSLFTHNIWVVARKSLTNQEDLKKAA
jgi:hypothetical protein